MVILYIGIALFVGFFVGIRIGYNLGAYPLQMPEKRPKEYYPGCCGMNKDHNDD